MPGQILEQFQGDILVLTLSNPPFNLLNARMRAALLEKLKAGFADKSVAGIVLHGDGALFSRGLPVAEYAHDLASPDMSEICARIERASKPVVMALHGLVLSAGFELSLAAHARVARATARLGLPEVTIGLPPGAGGSQRLPRLAGPGIALRLALSGKLAKASEFRKTQVIQELVDDGEGSEPPVKEAIALARSLAKTKRWKTPRNLPMSPRASRQFQDYVAQTRRSMAQKGGVLGDIVDCIEASQLLPLEQGLAYEAVRFSDRLRDPAGRAERHLAAARQIAAIEATLARGRSGPVSHIALIGGARQISEVAALALSLDRRTSLLTGDAAREAALLTEVRAQLEAMVKAGALTPEICEARLGRLDGLSGVEALHDVDLVFDTGGLALPETLPLKRGAIWVILDDPGRNLGEVIANRRAILGEEASIATLCMRRPVLSAPLAEISIVAGPEAQAISTLTPMLARDSRPVLVVSELPGGILGAMRVTVARAALVMLAAGIPFAEIEAAAQGLGFPRGPFRMMDETGAARTLALTRHVCAPRDVSLWPFRLLSDRLADTTDLSEGARAVLSRALAFHAPAGQTLEPDESFGRWLTEWRRETREEAPQRVPDWPKDIMPQRAFQAAIVNEAARLVEGGHVRRASDIDMALVLAAGFDAHRGGPLVQADLEGLLTHLRTARQLAGVDAVLWSPAPLLEDLVKNGQRFF